jgi:hypothetical protein
MPASEETIGPAGALERAIVNGAVEALATDGAPLDAAALAGDPPDADALVAALREQAQEGSVIACVGVLERLSGFARVVHALVALATERQVTVVLALPNDAALDATGGPRRSVWGEGAVAELRGLLPSDHVALKLLSLRGAALVPADGAQELSVGSGAGAGAGSAAPAGFVLAFGPRAQRLQGAAAVAAADLTAERAYERARTAELEVLRARIAALDARPQLAPANGGQPPEAEA